MKVFKQSRSGYNLKDHKEKHIILDNIGVKIITFVKKIDKIELPKEAKNWIEKQIKFYNNTENTIAKDVIIFISQYSQKPFNYYIDKRDNSKYARKQVNKLDDFSIDKKVMVKKLIKYIHDSPVTLDKFTVYSGISREDYDEIIKEKIYSTKRLRSFTFDKYHALNYAKYRGGSSKEQNKPWVVLKLDVVGEISCIYVEHEQQVILPPDTLFKIKGSKFYESKYKDIESETYSDDELIIEEVQIEAIPNYENLYKHYKSRYLVSKRILNKLDGVICDKMVRYVAMILIRKRDNRNEILFFIRSGDRKLMTPGGNVNIKDVYDDEGERFNNACYKGLVRETKEEFGGKLPKFQVMNKWIYKHRTMIFICETKDNINFKKNSEAVGYKWVDIKELNKERLVGYVAQSIKELKSRGLLNKYFKN